MSPSDSALTGRGPWTGDVGVRRGGGEEGGEIMGQITRAAPGFKHLSNSRAIVTTSCKEHLAKKEEKKLSNLSDYKLSLCLTYAFLSGYEGHSAFLTGPFLLNLSSLG